MTIPLPHFETEAEETAPTEVPGFTYHCRPEVLRASYRVSDFKKKEHLSSVEASAPGASAS